MGGDKPKLESALTSGKFGVQGFQALYRVCVGRDRAAENEIVGTVTLGFDGGHRSLLVIGGIVGAANTRGENLERRRANGSDALDFPRGGDNTVHARFSGQFRQMADLVFDITGNSQLVLQNLIVQTGQYGDREHRGARNSFFLSALGDREHASPHHFLSTGCMNIEHRHTHVHGRFTAGRDGVGDVVEFQVEKNLEAAPHELLQQCRAGRGE